jgi:glycosyltransferase involved in cell wall biosynthesis
LSPRITVGLPVYKGADLIPKALDCLQRQTFGNFEAIISVDGNDAETAAACRPFLTDPRFRMVVQPERLDWVGNFNWLLQQELKEFFCYRQHDDTTAPEFFEVLLQVADQEPAAAAVYCDCRYDAEVKNKWIEIAPSIVGEPLDRMFQYIGRMQATPARGLIRSAAIRQAGLVRSDEFRAPHQIYGWLAKILHWGDFRRVPAPLYYRFDDPRRFTREFYASSDDRKRGAWPTIFTGLLEAAMPLCRTPEQRLFFQQAILYRLVSDAGNRPSNEAYSAKRLIAECLERLNFEGNTHLLGVEEVGPVLQGLDLPESTRASRMRRGIHAVRQHAQLARIIYPRSRLSRSRYRLRHLLSKLNRAGA